MAENNNLDIFGLKPYGEAQKELVIGIKNTLSIFGKPAATELAAMIQDNFRVLRLNNIHNILKKAEGKFTYSDGKLDLNISPRLLAGIIDKSSWEDNEDIQEMWAGLIASSCTENGQNDNNLNFINILEKLTTYQAKILEFLCKNSEKGIITNEIIGAYPLNIEIKKLQTSIGAPNLSILDQNIDFLNAMGLIYGDINPLSNERVQLGVTGIALNFYVKCQGSNLIPLDYFKVTKPIDITNGHITYI